jgi:hypothetical protein
LLTLYLHFVVMQQTNLPARPLLNRSLEGQRLVVIGGTCAFGMARAKAAKFDHPAVTAGESLDLGELRLRKVIALGPEFDWQ